jgi:hypothetical protein
MNSCANTEHLKQRQLVAKLKDIPVFLVDRTYAVTVDYHGLQWYENHWDFKFKNGWRASVFKFKTMGSISGNHYEIVMLYDDGSRVHDAIPKTNKVKWKWKESEVDIWLNMISCLSPCGQFFVWSETIYE